MAEVIDFMAARDKRTETLNEALVTGYSNLDPSDPKAYAIRVRAMAEIHKQLVADDANREAEFHNRVQEELEEKEAKTSKWLEAAKVAGMVLAGIGSVIGGVSNFWAFNRVTSFEKDVDQGAPGAFRTMGDREIAQETMRHGFFRKK